MADTYDPYGPWVTAPDLDVDPGHPDFGTSDHDADRWAVVDDLVATGETEDDARQFAGLGAYVDLSDPLYADTLDDDTPSDRPVSDGAP